MDSIGRQCPSCGSVEITTFYRIYNVPVNSVLLLSDRQEALDFPTGEIILGYCKQCGFIFNQAFNPRKLEYSSRYESTQSYSSTFGAFVQNLADTLVKRYDLNNKNIIEIGCGQGEFLNLLCELGNNRGVGFDPAYNTQRNEVSSHQAVQFVADFYGKQYAGYKADFVCCKMTLEHIHDVAEFVSVVRRSIGDSPDTVVFFQVPNADRILRDLAFWDIYYEHCSYFSPGSLARLFRNSGFEVLDLYTDYRDQYLMIEARPARTGQASPTDFEGQLDPLSDSIAHFTENIAQAIEGWRQKLAALAAEHRRVVIWGGGSKAVSFLSTLEIQEPVEYVVDINPQKSGTYLPVTGQLIVAPEFLGSFKPDAVIVMNSVYSDEIGRELDNLSIETELLTV